MTRFARARGSKSSNERVPHPATDWNEMKQQLLDTNQTNDNKRKNGNVDGNAEDFKKMRMENYQKFLNDEVDNKNNPIWAEFDVKNEINQGVVEMKNEINQSVVEVKNEKDDDDDDDDDAPVEVTSKQPVETAVTPVKNKPKTNKIVEVKPQQKNKILKMVKNETKLIERKKKKQQKQLMKKKDDTIGENSNKPIGETKQPKKDPSELTEKESKLLERKKKKRLSQLAKKKLKKQQESDNNSKFVNNNNNNSIVESSAQLTHQHQQKIKKQRRKPVEETQIINGRQVAVTYMDGFPIKKEDYERLIKLRNDLHSKNIPKKEIDVAMKLERRKAEKALTRERKNVCYKCRKFGHNLSECPELDNEHTGAGVCFKCGSTEHMHFQCKVVKNDEYRYASCFICGEEGHIARQCKNNDRGVYPKGGNCLVCGSNEHLKRNCPQFKQEQQKSSDDAVVGTWNNNENPEIDNNDNDKQTIIAKQVKHIRF